MTNLQAYNKDGIEVYIDTNTGESFCSVNGYARMSGLTKQAVSRRLQGVNLEAQKMAEVLTTTGLQWVNLINEELVSEWLPNDNSAAASKLMLLGVRVFLHGIVGYKHDEAVKNVTLFTRDIAQSLVNSNQEFPVNFDDMWQWLGYSTKGNAKRNFENSGFVDGIDFRVFITSDKKGRPTEQIYLSIDCAKQWAMMSGTEQGKQVRLYFLECERIAKETKKPLTQAEAALYTLQLAVENERRLNAVESKVTHALKFVPTENYFGLIAYFNHIGEPYALPSGLTPSTVGKALVRLSKELGYDVKKVPDIKYGTVNNYHIDVLNKYFYQ